LTNPVQGADHGPGYTALLSAVSFSLIFQGQFLLQYHPHASVYPFVVNSRLVPYVCASHQWACFFLVSVLLYPKILSSSSLCSILVLVQLSRSFTTSPLLAVLSTIAPLLLARFVASSLASQTPLRCVDVLTLYIHQLSRGNVFSLLAPTGDVVVKCNLITHLNRSWRVNWSSATLQTKNATVCTPTSNRCFRCQTQSDHGTRQQSIEVTTWLKGKPDDNR
jgi:hypothetical protein